MTLGFIGLGNMGKPMAMNLLKANHQLAIYDINAKVFEEFADMNVVVKSKPSEIPQSAEIIFLSLPSHIVSEDVMLGANGILTTIKKDQIVVDMTTSLPSVSRKIGEQLRYRGAYFLDASVSGGVTGASAGTLSFMVGGEEEVFKKVKSLLEIMGKNIYYIGPQGFGNTMKLINNLLSITNTAVFIEGLLLGTKAGINPSVLFEVITSSSGSSKALQNKGPRILDGNFKAKFALDLEYKDLYLVGLLAQELKTPVFLASTARQMFEMARAKGFGNEDNVALVKVFEELLNIQVRK